MGKAVKDARGVEIQEGYTIVHVGRSGSYVWMDVGKVVRNYGDRVLVAYEHGGTGKPYVSKNILVVDGVQGV